MNIQKNNVCFIIAFEAQLNREEKHNEMILENLER